MLVFKRGSAAGYRVPKIDFFLSSEKFQLKIENNPIYNRLTKPNNKKKSRNFLIATLLFYLQFDYCKVCKTALTTFFNYLYPSLRIALS